MHFRPLVAGVSLFAGVMLLTSCSVNPSGIIYSSSAFIANAYTEEVVPDVTADVSAGEPIEYVETFQGTEIPVELLGDALEPIEDTNNPSNFDFEENVDLSAAEATERLASIPDEYEIGEPLSPEDLELVRAYAEGSSLGFDSGDPQESSEMTSAYFDGSSNGSEIVAVGVNPWTGRGSVKFSVSKTAQKVSAKHAGTLYVNTSYTGIGNTWRIDSTGKILTGRANVKKNSVSATYNAYGTVAKWPFIGLIYTKTASASNGKNDVAMDKSYKFDGLQAYWSASTSQTVKTKTGTFSLTY